MIVIARSPEGTVARHEAKQSIEIALNLNGLLCHSFVVPRMMFLEMTSLQIS
jgi:hypothetical protein